MDDTIILELKDRYFKLIAKENYPYTPEITKAADNIEEAIRKLRAEDKNEEGR